MTVSGRRGRDVLGGGGMMRSGGEGEEERAEGAVSGAGSWGQEDSLRFAHFSAAAAAAASGSATKHTTTTTTTTKLPAADDYITTTTTTTTTDSRFGHDDDDLADARIRANHARHAHRTRSYGTLGKSMGARESEGTSRVAGWGDASASARPSRMAQGVRHTVGIALLLVTVVLWTASNFLASTIFADDSYSKPYFVTYVNTAFFVIPLVPILVRKARHEPEQLHEFARAVLRKLRLGGAGAAARYTRAKEREETVAAEEREAFIGGEAGRDGGAVEGQESARGEEERLSFADTAKLSIEFCCLWFLANYFTAACLHYTTVASSTILTSTSSIWTLLSGAFIGIERFTLRKLLGVLASLLGIILISTVDISGTNSDDANRGTFPSKTPAELATGDALAFLSAVLYGFYAVTMKARIGDERRVSMPLFFGLVGLFNVLLSWPGLVLLHVTGIETFAMPPTGRIWAIVLINSTSSLVSDFCWAYAMLLTSPLVVTVGLSMTIPCSLIGQVLINGQTAHWAYWVGAAVVVGSFVFVNHEENKDEGEGGAAAAAAGTGLRRGVLAGETGREEGVLAREARGAELE